MRGFVTIATGSEKYYKLAANLLCSYRKHAMDDTPFAIICDRETEETKAFDKVVLMEQVNCSYMDKLLIYRYAPYDETIFIDADSLILADPSGLWDDFADADDLSCYGCTYPLDSDRAWFTHEGCGKYRETVQYLIDLHGGIYFLRRGNRCRSIFETAIRLAEEYQQYGFRHFTSPADEPVLAMSLAIHHSQPCNKQMRVLFVPSYWGRLRVTLEGKLLLDDEERIVDILHFGTKNTERFLYRYLIGRIIQESPSRSLYVSIWFQTVQNEIKAIVRHNIGQVLRKLLSDTVINRLKEQL